MFLRHLLVLSAVPAFVCGALNPHGARQTTLTGDSACSTLMCLSATVNDTDVTFVLQSRGRNTLGWMGMGFGRSMANTPMVIMWANSDGSITLSQRTAPREVMPTVDDNPPRKATLIESLSATSGDQPKFAFSVPKDGTTTQSVIFAFSVEHPGSSAVDATIVQHRDYMSTQLDLSKAISPSSTSAVDNPAATGGSGSSSGNSGSTPSDDIPLSPYQRLIVVHAIFCAFGFLVFLPSGALLARYLRSFTPTWFTGHWIAQFGVAGPVIIIGVALGIQSVAKAGALHLDDTHKRWGVAIFVLYFFQCLLGASIHFAKPKRNFSKTVHPAARRPPQNYAHAIFGLLIIALALYQVRSGYKVEWPSTTGRGEVANSVNVIWYIWVVLLPIIYALGLALLPRQFKQETASMRHPVNGDDDDSHGFDMSNVQHGYRDYQ